MEQRNYMAEVQALIDQKWKENPEEMKRVMEEIKAKEKKEKKAKVKNQKRVSFDPQLTQELIEELNKRCELDISKVKDLVMRGADIMAKNIHDDTVLHQACWFNDDKIAKFLLDRGADVNAINKYGQTPLHWAGSSEMKTLLKKYQK
jgi:ankyrin repeat protein